MKIWTILLVALLAACGDAATRTQLNTGDAAPAFRTTYADGSPAGFPEGWAGRPVVIRFWADWCRYCEPEMQAIDRVYRRLQPRGLEVIAVNAGQDAKTVAAFMKKLGVAYPALLDEDSAIARRYAVIGLPTTYFVDAAGVVRGKLVGEAEEAGFERAALAILK